MSEIVQREKSVSDRIIGISKWPNDGLIKQRFVFTRRNPAEINRAKTIKSQFDV